MAKQIKTIKCPQCGSTQKAELEPNHYRCDSCGTEYFLDDDGINVNVRHTFGNNNHGCLSLIGITSLSINFIVWIILGVIFAIVLFIVWLSSLGGGGFTPKPKVKGLEDGFYYSVYESTPVEINDKGYIICFASRRKSGATTDDSFVYFFYDIKANKAVHETELDISKRKSANLCRFADGSCYLSINKKYLYKLNKDKMRFDDFTPRITEGRGEFSTGVAAIEVERPMFGEAFEVMNNIGERYTYYPIADRLYNGKELNAATKGMDNLLPGARDSVIYLFSFYIRPPIQLLEVTFKYNAGGPMDKQMTERFTSRPYSNRQYRITKTRDVAPGRNWFDPHVAYFGHDDIVVSVRANDEAGGQVSLQKIDTRTGKLIWTTPVRTPIGRPFFYFDESIKVDDKYYVIKDDNRIYIIIDNDGKLIKEIDLTSFT